MNKSTVTAFNVLWAATCAATIYSVYQTREMTRVARQQVNNTSRIGTQLEIMNNRHGR